MTTKYIPFEELTNEGREKNRAALRQEVVGSKCVHAGRVNGPADTFATPEEVAAFVPAGMVIRSAEIYETGSMNIFVGLPGMPKASGFVRYRAH